MALPGGVLNDPLLPQRHAILADSLIVGLFFLCGPFAVLWRVWSVIVNTFDGEFWGRLRSHVGIESKERIAPTVAHGNTPASIVGISLTGLVVTPLFSRQPRVVFWSSFHSMSRSFVDPFKAALSPQASATLRHAFAKIVAVYDSRIAAGTSHVPYGTAWSSFTFRWRSTLNRQPSECLAGKVY